MQAHGKMRPQRALVGRSVPAKLGRALQRASAAAQQSVVQTQAQQYTELPRNVQAMVDQAAATLQVN